MAQQRSWLKYLNLSLMFIVLCCASVLCFAQSDRGSVSGIITDPTGAVVIGSQGNRHQRRDGYAELHRHDRGWDLYRTGGACGRLFGYGGCTRIHQLVRNGITVSVGEVATVDLRLGVGQGTTTVTVTEDAPLLQTDSAQINSEVTTRDLNELPININGIGAIRDPMGFASLLPGSIGGGWNDIHVQGSPATTYRVFMDGLDDTNATKGAISDEQQPSVESLAEESVMINDYSAQFGESGGGVFNYTSKSGTNRLHGTAFNYLENEDLDAGQPFNYVNANTLQKYNPVQRELDFGASLGGPVFIPHVYNGHDKTFFFFAYEEYHNAQTLNNGTITVPTQAYLTGDLSSNILGPIKDNNGNPVVDCLGRQLYNGEVFDPSTTRTATCTGGPTGAGSTAVVRDGFGTGPGGTGVPTNFIGAPGTWDPVAVKALAYMPTPAGATADALTNNYPNLQPNNKYQYLASIKIDHYIGEKWHFSGYYMHEIGNKDNADDGINTVGGSTRWNHTPAPQLYLNANYTATPNLVLHAGWDWTRHDALQDAAVQNFDQTTLGLPSLANMPGGAAKTFPIFSGLTVNHQNVPQLGINNAPFIDNDWYDTESAIWTHGRHAFDFGGDFRHQLWGTHNDLSDGSYGFSENETSEPSENGQNLYGASLGSGFASFALGQLDGANIGNDDIQWFIRMEGSFYGQDTWKLTNKLTVNLGLRWDLEGMQKEQHLRVTQFSPTVVNPSAGGLLGGTEYEGSGKDSNGDSRCNCVFEHFYPWMIQPRIGASYQLTPKTVIHAATGFYSGPQLFMNEEGYSNQGFGFNVARLTSPSYGISAGQLSNGIPFSPAALTATNFDPGAFPNLGSTNSPPSFIVSNNGRPPRFLQTTVGVERQIINNLSLNVSFIDDRGVWLNSDNLTNTTNELTPTMLSQKYGLNVTDANDFNLLTQPISSPSVAARGFKAPYSTFPSGATLAQALRPFPQFGGIGDMYEHDGNWWYDALQVKVTRRISNGLSGGVGYNWSKNLGTVGATSPTYTTSIYAQDPSLPPKSQKSFESIDEPQMLNFYFNYEVPRFSFDQNGWKRALLAGWTTDGNFHYASGFPQQVPNTWTTNLDSVTFANATHWKLSVFANRVPGQPLFLQNLNNHKSNIETPFLNAAAWSAPALGTYSTSKPFYNDYRQARQPSEELGIGKVFPIKEGTSFSLRADFFNVFNRWVYPGFNNTSNPAATGSGNQLFGVMAGSITNAGGNYAPRSGEFIARFQF